MYRVDAVIPRIVPFLPAPDGASLRDGLLAGLRSWAMLPVDLSENRRVGVNHLWRWMFV